MLTISFATEKFHQYIYSKLCIHIQTNHKLLEGVLKKPMCKAPLRLQRLMLTLQPYDLVVSHVPGKFMYLVDTLSRAYIEGEPETSLNEKLSRVIHSLVENTTVNVAKMDEIREASDAEKLLRPKVVVAHDALKRRQVCQNTYYDKHSAPLAPLRPNDVVRVHD